MEATRPKHSCEHRKILKDAKANGNSALHRITQSGHLLMRGHQTDIINAGFDSFERALNGLVHDNLGIKVAQGVAAGTNLSNLFGTNQSA